MSLWLKEKCTLLFVPQLKGAFRGVWVRYILSKRPVPSPAPISLLPCITIWKRFCHLCILYCPLPSPLPPMLYTVFWNILECFLCVCVVCCMHIQQLIASLYVWCGTPHPYPRDCFRCGTPHPHPHDCFRCGTPRPHPHPSFWMRFVQFLICYMTVCIQFVWAVYRCMHMQYTGVRTWSIQAYVHEVYKCMYMQ